MQKWEYLVIVVYESNWVDSNGRSGKFEKVRGPGGDWYNPGPLLNTLGEQGWELTGTLSLITRTAIRCELYLKRPRS